MDLNGDGYGQQSWSGDVEAHSISDEFANSLLQVGSELLFHHRWLLQVDGGLVVRAGDTGGDQLQRRILCQSLDELLPGRLGVHIPSRIVLVKGHTRALFPSLYLLDLRKTAGCAVLLLLIFEGKGIKTITSNVHHVVIQETACVGCELERLVRAGGGDDCVG